MRRAIWIVVIATGCEAAEPEADPDRAWVMVDEPAARVGFLIKHGGWVDAPALPTDLDPDRPAWLVDPDRSQSALEIPAGMIGHVDETGAVELLEPGIEVPGDRLFVRGSAAAVEALADLLDARVESGADGSVLLAERIYQRTSFLELPDGIEAVSLTAPGARASGSGRVGYAIATGQEEPLAELVGVYHDADGVVIVDAEGGFLWQRCGRPDRVGRVVLDAQGVNLVGDDGVTSPLVLAGDALEDGESDGLTFAGDR